MEYRCPQHQCVLEARGKLWHCTQCARDYRVRASCADCAAELERLAACGATNWWCPRCNELKSKRAVNTELAAL